MTGGPRCEVDLVETSCEIAGRLLSQGAAFRCPSNDCVGVQQINGQVYRWGPVPLKVFGTTCTGTWGNPTAACSPLAFKGYRYILGLILLGSVDDWNAADGVGDPSFGSWDYSRAVLGGAREIAAPVADPKFIGGFYLASASGPVLVELAPGGAIAERLAEAVVAVEALRPGTLAQVARWIYTLPQRPPMLQHIWNQFRRRF